MLFSSADTDRLEELLASDAFKGEAMTLDMLQGFLCAILSGPESVPVDTWMKDVLGESPEYESPAQADEVRGLLLRLHDALAAALAEQQDFDLILYGAEDDPEAVDYASWCDGYVYGSQISPVNWFEAAGKKVDELSDYMEVFFLLNGLLKEDAKKHKQPWLSKKEEEKALTMAREDLPDTIHAVYLFWESRRAAANPVRRESAKVGRNDLCPCGSGKKFKQCCGSSEKLH
jgi:uncharacterized protein